MVDSRSSSLSELARLGFEALSETVPKLEHLVKLVGDRGHGALAAISASSSPDRALDSLIRLAEKEPKGLSKILAKHDQTERLCRVLAASNGLADFLLRHPQLFTLFASQSRIPAP
jgi:glutamate-ammonia-ligase adenylyltransferase